ncbi:YegP family protein [Lentilactobacillus kosonis]|uniref:Prophage Lp2 protein 14 n=1 Tax=Lentilactobacillus kosonis TaxID=2810561 RepID=A0A401FKU9_9LACO|nr:DUF1508 domain-containing protein [Lentilactobacillus kosonis]GAY72898.1 prophage Lp2 protein 14 [Lentilactobacillus kosonis]
MYFSIRKSPSGQFYFLIKSENDEVVATSETYFYKETAINTINSIKSNINKDSVVVDMT